MTGEQERIYLRLAPRDIDFLNRIMEGYDGLGIVSTLDRRAGLVVIRVTPDTRADVLAIISSLPVNFEFIVNHSPV